MLGIPLKLLHHTHPEKKWNHVNILSGTIDVTIQDYLLSPPGGVLLKEVIQRVSRGWVHGNGNSNNALDEVPFFSESHKSEGGLRCRE
jgi:hypothetical protein